MKAKDQVWLVTGASKGLGLTLAKKVLESGGKVIATSRSKNELTAAIGEPDSCFLPLEMDLINEESVRAGIGQALEKFSRIDVVVNNAGFGQIGTLEELSDSEVRRNFDVNVFGSLNIIRCVVPHLREQGSGNIFNIASIGGYIGNFPGWGVYCATKFAVAGFTEALAAEVKPFGVKATVVYPGYFRTNFLAKGSVGVPANPIAVYAEARALQALHQNDINGNQPNDPEKAADALMQVAAAENPPVHLFLGQDAWEMAGVKNDIIHRDLRQWEALTRSTAFTAPVHNP